MAITINVEDKDPNEILDIVRQLRASGLELGVHFDFAYNQSRWDEMIGEIPKHTRFVFYDEKYSTLFALKYLS